jgi:hypothetical protein
MDEEEALISLDELADVLDWEMSDEERRLASGVIESLSDEARLTGSTAWLGAYCTPGPVRRIVRTAAARFMRNPDGYVQSRAGDETVVWSDKTRPVAEFTETEVNAIRSYAGRGNVTSVPVYGFSYRRKTGPVDRGYVGITGSPGERPFPFLNPGGSPW